MSAAVSQPLYKPDMVTVKCIVLCRKDYINALAHQFSGADINHWSYMKLSECFWNIARELSGLLPEDKSPEAEEKCRVLNLYKRALWKIVNEKKVIREPGELDEQAVIQDFFLGVQAIRIE